MYTPYFAKNGQFCTFLSQMVANANFWRAFDAKYVKCHPKYPLWRHWMSKRKNDPNSKFLITLSPKPQNLRSRIFGISRVRPWKKNRKTALSNRIFKSGVLGVFRGKLIVFEHAKCTIRLHWRAFGKKGSFLAHFRPYFSSLPLCVPFRPILTC